MNDHSIKNRLHIEQQLNKLLIVSVWIAAIPVAVSEEQHTPLLLLTFKIPSNSPPLVHEEGHVTPKVGCMGGNYSPRMSCSRREHWSGSIR